MKNRKEIIIITLLSLLIIGFIIAIIVNDISKNKYLINIKYDELKEKIDNKEDFILYIGKEGCSACKSFHPKFKSIVNKYKIETYYIDLAKYSEEQIKYIENNISFTGTPTVVFMIKGKDELNSDTKIVGNISEDKIIEKLKNRGYIK